MYADAEYFHFANVGRAVRKTRYFIIISTKNDAVVASRFTLAYTTFAQCLHVGTCVYIFMCVFKADTTQFFVLTIAIAYNIFHGFIEIVMAREDHGIDVLPT